MRAHVTHLAKIKQRDADPDRWECPTPQQWTEPLRLSAQGEAEERAIRFANRNGQRSQAELDDIQLRMREGAADFARNGYRTDRNRSKKLQSFLEDGE